MIVCSLVLPVSPIVSPGNLDVSPELLMSVSPFLMSVPYFGCQSHTFDVIPPLLVLVPHLGCQSNTFNFSPTLGMFFIFIFTNSGISATTLQLTFLFNNFFTFNPHLGCQSKTFNIRLFLLVLISNFSCESLAFSIIPTLLVFVPHF